MEYVSIKQISEKWGICARRVQTLCTEGRIEGAQRVGTSGSFLQMLQNQKMLE